MQNSEFDWNQALKNLEGRLGSEVVDRWLAPLRVRTVSPESLHLEAPNQFFRDWIQSHYLEALESVSAERAVRISCGGDSGMATEAPSEVKLAPEPPRISEFAPDLYTEAISGAGAAKSPSSWERPLNPKFTFEHFVVGPGSRFAHAASMAVAESPAKAYNPLFIYGGVGLGKTHLMHAMGHAVMQRWPNKRVVYLSSEGFTNELISSIQTKQTVKFRDRYRTVDVLLIDDIHFIAGKEATQEEFFHTFNALYDAHKQIVISSDRSPKEIAGLEERLVSRFEWGLVTDVQKPDLETRIAILRKKAEESRLQVSSDVINFIAQQITSNIRELEGALIRVVAYCNFSNQPQTVALAKEVLKDMVKEVSSRITIDLIQQRVADFFDLEVTVLRGPSRQRSILYPRQVAMYLVRTLTSASLPEIGKAFGGRDHTTVMHAIEKIKKELAQDVHKKNTVEQLNEVVLSAGR